MGVSFANTVLIETFTFGKTQGAGLQVRGGRVPPMSEDPPRWTLPARIARAMSTLVDRGDFSKGELLVWAVAKVAMTISNSAASGEMRVIVLFKGSLPWL
jgi:hypothetical protein